MFEKYSYPERVYISFLFAVINDDDFITEDNVGLVDALLSYYEEYFSYLDLSEFDDLF